MNITIVSSSSLLSLLSWMEKTDAASSAVVADNDHNANVVVDALVVVAVGNDG